MEGEDGAGAQLRSQALAVSPPGVHLLDVLCLKGFLFMPYSSAGVPGVSTPLSPPRLCHFLSILYDNGTNTQS